MTVKNSSKFGYSYWNSLRQKSAEKVKAQKAPLKARLKVWFDYWTKHCHTRCENCNQPIERWNRLELISAQAHILPKGIFEDVCDELDNHMTLGKICGCHDKFDRSWDSASRMKIFPVAWQRVQGFLDKITDPVQRRKIPDIFLNPLTTHQHTE